MDALLSIGRDYNIGIAKCKSARSRTPNTGCRGVKHEGAPMPVSGLVLTLAVEPDRCSDLMQTLRTASGLELGTYEGRRLAAVLDTPTDAHNKEMWSWLKQLAGVDHVDVVFVSLEHDESPPEPPNPSRSTVDTRRVPTS